MFEGVVLAFLAFSSLCSAVKADSPELKLQVDRSTCDTDIPRLSHLEATSDSTFPDQFRRRIDVEKDLFKRGSKKASRTTNRAFTCNRQGPPKKEPKGGYQSLHITDDAFFNAASRVAGTLTAHAALSHFASVPGFDGPEQMAATVGVHAVASGMMAPYVYNASKRLLDKAQQCITPLCRGLSGEEDPSLPSSSSSSSRWSSSSLAFSSSPADQENQPVMDYGANTSSYAGKVSRSRYAQKALRQKSKSIIQHDR